MYGHKLLAWPLLLALLPAHAQTTDAFVVSSPSATVTAIDTATATVRGTAIVAAGPSQVTVSPDGTRVYVSHPSLGIVSVLDGDTRTVLGTISTAVGAGALAVSPDGQRLFVATPGAVQSIDLASGTTVATIAAPGTATEILFAPDGSKAYLASGVLTVIDVASNTATQTAIPATSIALAQYGQRLWTANSTGVAEVDTATNSVTRSLAVGGTAGPLAITPDGSRLYVGVQGFTLVNSTYGTFAVAFRNVTVIDTRLCAAIATINIGTPVTRMAVTPDRKDLYMVITTNAVTIASINTNAVRLTVPVAAGISGLAMEPIGAIYPYVIDAVDDVAPTPVVSPDGGTPVANVLANDTLGGVRATTANVTLSQVSSTNSGLRLNAATGAVIADPGVAPGAHSLVYKICEIGAPDNCDQATVSVTVRLPYVIDAVDDAATSNTGKIAVANVLINDTYNGVRATTAVVRMTTVSASHTGITLSAAGAVSIAPGTPVGPQTLVYRICEIASPSNCDDATVTVTVIPYVVDAVNDSGAATRAGGTAVANVLANDTFGASVATLANVRLTLVTPAPHTGVALNVATGAVTVAAGTPIGQYSLAYQICEIASPANCDQAAVSVTVNSYLIDAVNDSATASSKRASTAIASVLWNDTLGGARATPSTVAISLVSMSPANSMVQLDTTTGAVNVLGKTDSLTYTIVYRICEIAYPTNCDNATVTLYLSGGI